MHTLVLLRHAKSDYPVGVGDHDRPLSERGKRNAETIASHLLAVVPANARIGVAVSSARRTQETWEYVAADMPRPDQYWQDASLYLAEPAQIVEVARCFKTDVGIVVGHNPGIEELARSIQERDSTMTTGLDEKFPTASFAVIRVSGFTAVPPYIDGVCSAFVTCR